jgi:hypothetical protein
MRLTAFMMIMAGAFFGQALLGQTMTEFGAAAAVGTVGGAGGQPVSKGLAAVLGKVSAQTAKAAGKEESRQPALELAQGQPKGDTSGVPLPPPPGGKRAHAPSMPVAQLVVPQEAVAPLNFAEVVPVVPAPPEMSAEKLKSVPVGMSRADLLRMGFPASKITMDEDGEMVEIYSYREKDRRLGTVRLKNGAVSSVE